MGAFISRIWHIFISPAAPVPKSENALKFGILGAARIVPMGLIVPAKSHPEVIVQAIAARDRTRAEAFAKKHGIPEVKDSYEEIINDPTINCIYIPLPNAFHYPWALRALAAGKHVLLEKPSVSNAAEAVTLFSHSSLSLPNAPVILEGFHFQFFPSWQLFRSLIPSTEIAYVSSESQLPAWMIKDDDISLNYKLAGGAMMNLGVYHFAALRLLFGSEPEECVSCKSDSFTEGPQKGCDFRSHATFKFPGGGIGEAKCDLKGGKMYKVDFTTVRLHDKVIPTPSLPASQEQIKSRTLTLWGMMHGILWHRIDIIDTFTIRDSTTKAVVKTWKEKSTRKAYTFDEAGGEFTGLKGGKDWMSFRYQLEEFVNRVKGRETQYWIEGEESVRTMKMVDLAYEKNGLGARVGMGEVGGVKGQ
ncbi:NAD(P)-binding Rossmann-fold containing protein [Glarea lozoyensis ATCC 20868]|uniref:D-xylose 1-dehydrogenase (NADP(+), D-xylono-1,5-lactone-forming) n=1 Tax=Glarea lozoyensis (strain ATCC 20868 / MF5171) TaxID=1116229 RepID=S3D7Z8_GLAL2|nr:NAD(P)-binding Rossmann-fold containing protein [Glarea lozoyensis ATCC 20868]EPE33234.1 NAD(P)-binding Rossmann-fold containing protein [Glarea lozoyensis ATCC 20868]